MKQNLNEKKHFCNCQKAKNICAETVIKTTVETVIVVKLQN